MRRRLAIALGLLLLLAVRAGAQDRIEYYHVDAVGSVRAVTDAAGATVTRHDYFPFGEEYLPPAATSDTKRFAGKERDAETAQDYFGARYYVDRTARFTSVDPVYNWQENLLDPQRWNRYAYVRNNPLRYIDPDGRDAVWVKHADGTATLVIPVQFRGSDATPANIAAIVARANGIAVMDPKVSISVISTSKPIDGALNHLDFGSGANTKLCGAVGECVNRLGGDNGHINSANGDAISGAAHDILHFAGIRDAYTEGPRDPQGNRTSKPLPGFTNSNIMTSRAGTQLTAQQAHEAQQNSTTRICSGQGTKCQ